MKRLKQIEDKIKDIEAKIDNLTLRIGKLGDSSGLDELDRLRKELENLKNAHSETVNKVKNNKDQIDLIWTKLREIIKGYHDGDENLKKEIEELKKKLEDLDTDFREFVEKVNIDEIYRKLKYLDETKADKTDVEEKYDHHQSEIDAINRRLDALFNQLLNQESGKAPVINLDFSKYLQKDEFEKHKKENDEEFKKIWDEIERLNNLIKQIFDILKTKANLSDLEDLKKFLLGKIDELAYACNKKFADKNETTNNFKYLEDQLKKILDMLSKKDTHNEADSWLIAKKGYSCAACESQIADLRDDSHKFIPWNQMPLRDPSDKLYRMGNGFSKMLQMLNFDNSGNVCLNPNAMNETTMNSNESNSRVGSAFPSRVQNNNFMSNNMNNRVKPIIQKRIQSARPKMRNELNINLNKSKLQTKSNRKDTSNIDFGTETKKKDEQFPKIYETDNTNNEEGPKITKIIRKTSKNKALDKNKSSIN